MSSKSVELANAIVGALNDDATSFVLNFQAKRRAAPLTERELDDEPGLTVSVFTGAKKAERVTRGSYQRNYKPIIAIQRKLDGGTYEANLILADKLEQLSEQIETRLEDEDLADLSFVGFDEELDREPYNAEAMRDLGFFAVAITLEYTG